VGKWRNIIKFKADENALRELPASIGNWQECIEIEAQETVCLVGGWVGGWVGVSV